MASQARWNGFTGRIWPVGRSLETPAVDDTAEAWLLTLLLAYLWPVDMLCENVSGIL